jgi:pimeloyl-ACP methyl ester carboxylesterase
MKARLERLFNRVPDSTLLWERKNLGFLAARLGFGRDPHPSHVELVRRMLLECTPSTRLDAPRALVGLDLLADLPKITIPTLVIGGTADIVTPPSYAQQIARAIPNARLELMEDGGHMLMLERIDAVDQLIVDFAREVGVAP